MNEVHYPERSKAKDRANPRHYRSGHPVARTVRLDLWG